MRKKLIPLIGLTLSLAVAGIIMGSTLSSGSGAPAQDPAGQIEEPSGNRPPIRSDESIDSDQAVTPRIGRSPPASTTSTPTCAT